MGSVDRDLSDGIPHSPIKFDLPLTSIPLEKFDPNRRCSGCEADASALAGRTRAIEDP